MPHRDGGQSVLYVNDGSGGFSEVHAVGPPESATRAVTFGDLNGDGTLDIVLGDQLAGGVWLYFGRDGDVLRSAPADRGFGRQRLFARGV